MPRFGFCGGSYTPKSLIADSQRLVNMFPEVIQSGLGRGGSAIYLLPTPGLKIQYVLDDGPVRAHYTIPRDYPGNDRAFVVGGGTLYELFGPPNKVARGNIASDGYPCTIASNGSQLAITSNQKLYIYNLTTNILQGPIIDTEGDVVKALSVVYLNGFFVASCVLPDGSGTNIRFSAVFDGTSWDPIDDFDAESCPKSVTILRSFHNEIWAFGPELIQPFQTTGVVDSPFQPIESGTINIGLYGPASIAVLDNQLIWLGRQRDEGRFSIWTAEGYTPRSISNPALDTILSNYNQVGLQLAQAFAFGDEGHGVYQITFTDPSINATWRYDKSLPPELAWYEVGTWNPNTGQFEAHQSVTHSFAFGMHLVGDRGNISVIVHEMSTKYFDDSGINIRRLRRSPHLSAEQLYLFFQKLEIVAETGLALNGDGAGSDPQIMVRWSDDGGKTWKNEVMIPLGKIGEYRRRIRLWRLGRSLDRVFEIVFNDAVPFRLIDGFVKYTVGKE